MSEKRFKLVEFYIEDVEDDKKYYCDSEDMIQLVDFINSLLEENEQLQKELDIERTDCKNAKESRDWWRLLFYGGRV